jgi:hypothetical protein
MRNIFMKVKDMLEFACSTREGAIVINEGDIPLPPHLSCDGLKESNNEESSQTHPTPALKDNNKPISENQEK